MGYNDAKKLKIYPKWPSNDLEMTLNDLQMTLRPKIMVPLAQKWKLLQKWSNIQFCNSDSFIFINQKH